MRLRAATIATFIAWSAVGCSTKMVIVTTPVVKGLSPVAPEDCATRLFASETGILEQCEKIGEMSLGDSGGTRTRYCGALQVRDAVRRTACELGGNAAVIARVARPMMTCVEARATLFRCDPARMPARPDWAVAIPNPNAAKN